MPNRTQISTVNDLFTALISANNSEDVHKVLTAIGDGAYVGLEAPFGPLNLRWHAFGDTQSNISTIGLATKPGRSLAERVTNAIDAILEARLPQGPNPPHSARVAANKWYGRPNPGPNSSTVGWTQGQELARGINVVVQDSGKPGIATVDVVDAGIGIRPEDFGRTILSLQAGNKITKFYLLGAFGQGGASTLAFSDYVLVLSRHKDQPELMGFTLIRVLNLGENYKEDAYAYLTLPDGSVPTIELGPDPLPLYFGYDGVKAPALMQGTVVRHFGYRITGLEAALVSSPGNLYHYLNVALFDPLIPFRVLDLRDPKRYRDEIITGARNRLMKLLGRDTDPADSGSSIRHYRPMEYIAPAGYSETTIGLEYWVVYNYRKRGKDDNRVVLRPSSNELYVNPGHPVIGTVNGQNQGEMTAAILREADLTMTARHIVIHIDATLASPKLRRELFTTTREGFKDGPVLDDLRRVMLNILKEDTELAAIEKELTETLAARTDDDSDADIRREVTSLLVSAGFSGSEKREGFGKGKEKPERRAEEGEAIPSPPPPIVTMPYPALTFLSIVSPDGEFTIRQKDNRVIRIETDADDRFDTATAVRAEPDYLEVVSTAPLHGGRKHWRLRASAEAPVDASGEVVVTITLPNGRQVEARKAYRILEAAQPKPKGQGKINVPAFEIVSVDPELEYETFLSLWPDAGEDVEQWTKYSYKAMSIGGGVHVFYNLAFGPFQEHLENAKKRGAGFLDLYRKNYSVWVGYHGILQETNKAYPEDVEPEVIERQLQAETQRVGTMVAKQAYMFAEYQVQRARRNLEAVA